MTPLELLQESQRAAAARDPIDLVVDWQGRFVPAPGGALVAAVFGPGSNTPIAVCSTDIRGAQWIAARLNRAAWLEQCLTNMRDGLLSASVQSPGASVAADTVLGNLDAVLRGPTAATLLDPEAARVIGGGS